MKIVPKTLELLNMLYSWQLDDDIRKSLMGHSIATDLNNCVNYYDKVYDGYKNHLFGILDNKGIYSGAIMLHTEPGHYRCEMHMVMDKNHRGKLTILVLEKLFNYIFEELKYRALYTYTPENNKNAISIMKKFGAEEKGFLNDFYHFQGDFYGAYILEITNKNRRTLCR